MRTNINKIKAGILAYFTEGSELVASMNELSEWDTMAEVIDNFQKVQTFVENLLLAAAVVVKDLEADLTDVLEDDEIDAIVTALDEMIKLPWYLEAMDGLVLEAIVRLVKIRIKDKLSEIDLSKVQEALEAGRQYVQQPIK